MIDRVISAKEECMGCKACYSICPQNCITMESDAEGFSYPKVNYDKCIECKLCIKVCPVMSKIPMINNEIRAYACINKSEEIRSKSSSGGIFTLISNHILEEGGVVFGACFDSEFEVKHNYIRNKSELNKLRRSKYVQSDICETYKKAKELLNNGQKVLFTGTPCQIAGLNSYLGNSYNNLICQDIICQGVPSPLIWNKYLDSRIKKEGKGNKVKSVNFRFKSNGWQNYKMMIEFDSGRRYVSNRKDDSYFKVFMNFLSIRPACFKCKFKSKFRSSDITLADFWGIKNVDASFDDNKGTSLVLINTNKGKEIFDHIRQLMIFKEVDYLSSINNNPMYNQSIVDNKNRESFFIELPNVDFDILSRKYYKEKKILKFLRKLCSGDT